MEDDKRKMVKADFAEILTELLPKLIEDLSLSEEAQEKAVEVINTAREKSLTKEKNPVSILAAAVYIGAIEAGEWRSQVEVAQAAGVSKSILYKRYREFADKLEL